MARLFPPLDLGRLRLNISFIVRWPGIAPSNPGCQPIRDLLIGEAPSHDLSERSGGRLENAAVGLRGVGGAIVPRPYSDKSVINIGLGLYSQ